MKLIKIEDQGAEVKILQELLALNGLPVEVDGDFGKKTEEAVIQFQRSRHDKSNKPLIVDGIVGDSTWEALMTYNHIVPAAKEDPLTVKRINRTHPKIRAELQEIYKEILDRKISIRITDSLRTFDEQNRLYAQGRTAPGKIVTNAKAGQSYHNYGLAVDFALLLPDGKNVTWDRSIDLNSNQLKDWDEVVAVFKHHGWDWGGNWTSFKDYPHFEKTFGLTTCQLLDIHNSGKLKDGYVLLEDHPLNYPVLQMHSG